MKPFIVALMILISAGLAGSGNRSSDGDSKDRSRASGRDTTVASPQTRPAHGMLLDESDWPPPIPPGPRPHRPLRGRGEGRFGQPHPPGPPPGEGPPAGLPGLRGNRPHGPPGRDDDRRFDGADRLFDGWAPNERATFLAFLADHFPEIHAKLEQARRYDPRAFRRMLRKLGPPMLRLLRVWRQDPELARQMIAEHKNEMAIRRLQMQYRRATDPPVKQELEQELRQLLAARFEMHVARMEHEIEQLRERLDAQTQRLQHQKANKSQVIEEEIAKTLKDWSEP